MWRVFKTLFPYNIFVSWWFTKNVVSCYHCNMVNEFFHLKFIPSSPFHFLAQLVITSFKIKSHGFFSVYSFKITLFYIAKIITVPATLLITVLYSRKYGYKYSGHLYQAWWMEFSFRDRHCNICCHTCCHFCYCNYNSNYKNKYNFNCHVIYYHIIK